MRKLRNLLVAFFHFWLLLLVAVGFSVNANAITVIDEFVNLTYFDSAGTTGVWNVSQGALHPSLSVIGWNSGSGATNTSFSVGEGSHGVFDRTTYANFSQGGDVSGNIIRLNTNTYPELKVTSFTLDSGWTLLPSGTNPLIIRSLSSVTINGTINCSGDNGTGLNTTYSTLSAGGTGRCGGANGGNGATSVTAATVGASGGGTTLGGGLGGVATLAAGAGGGGGGGAFSQGAAAGVHTGTNPGGSSGGIAGTNQQNDEFTILATGIGGGSGGGGGGAHVLADANRSNGAGGGAGGGIVLIYAVDDINVTATGAIRANGGTGGSAAPGGGRGGGGGGGGGGSILLFSGASAIVTGPVTALEGAAGTTDGGAGGVGFEGRTWITDNNGSASGVGDNPISQLVLVGSILFDTGAKTYSSLPYDMRNTSPTYTSATMSTTLPGASTAQLDVAGSSDGNTFSSFVSASSISSLNGKRYLKFRITMNSAVAATPAKVNSVTLNFDGFSQQNFQFNATSCGSVMLSGGKSIKDHLSNEGSGPSVLFQLLVVLMPLLFLGFLRIDKKRLAL